MRETGNNTKRIRIDYFEGVNSLVGANVSKKNELSHAENARSKTIGTIEKREGMTVLGTNTSGQPFVTSNNYGLFSFENNQKKGLYRISVTENSTLSISVSDRLVVSESNAFSGGALSLTLDTLSTIIEKLTISEYTNVFIQDSVTIYYLNDNSQWVPLTGSGASIGTTNKFDIAYAEGNVFLVNKTSANRYISSDGTTVTTSSSGSGHLFNTPQAGKINFYKGRIYLADFIQNNVNYKTTILRSSYPMGLVALVNNDYTAQSTGITIDVTDTKYIYSDSGANTYEIYRGGTRVTDNGGTPTARTFTVTTVNETSIVITWTGGETYTLLASDEIWIAGTYTGSKVFRWAKNPTVSGKDVKQYDTFKLSGGENDSVTMMTNVGNIMLIANKNAMSSWNDYTLENFDIGIGCVSKKGYVKTIGTLYFLHYTGVYATSGGIPKFISGKVERYINGASTTGKENCAAGKKGRSVFFTLGDVTLYKPDGSVEKTLPDVCLEYNIVQNNWFIHTGVSASEFATFIESTDSDKLEFADTNGRKSVREFLANGISTDDGKEIPFRIDTNPIVLQPDFENSNKLIEVITEVERGSAIQTFIDTDKKNEFYPIEGRIIKGISAVKITNRDYDRGTPVAAKTVTISLRDTSNQVCKISKMAITYLPTSEEDIDNDI